MAKESKVFGITMTGASVDFPAVMARKNTVVKQLVGGLGGILKSHGMTIVKGTGEIIDAKTVKVKETGETIKADKIIIATGSVPSKVPIPGIDLPGVINSDGALSL
jgi:dihydrolipoamide dehydrogenase